MTNEALARKHAEAAFPCSCTPDGYGHQLDCTIAGRESCTAAIRAALAERSAEGGGPAEPIWAKCPSCGVNFITLGKSDSASPPSGAAATEAKDA